MATASTPLVDRAADVFTDLGYSVTREGRELRAERKWRVVQVLPVDGGPLPSGSGQFQCYVTRREQARELRRRLATEMPECEWAVIGISEAGDHEVHRAPEDQPV